MSAGAVHVLVPGGVDDPRRTSGGNTYDRRLCDALGAAGWRVERVEVEGGWPWSPRVGAASLGRSLARVPDDATVLVDGLLASRLPAQVARAAARLRLVVLVHLPVGVCDAAARPAEREVVAAAAAVVTTSDWSRDWLLRHHDLPADRVHVARPGVDPAAVAPATDRGSSLLALGALGPVKGQDRLVAALADLRGLDWRCRCVGSTADADFVAALRATAYAAGVGGRVTLTGVLTGPVLEAVWHDTDLLVVASRVETYGMVVTEAVARGIPVVALDVGGVAEALGRGDDLPGLLVPPDDGAALAGALREWLTDRDLRARLRAAALRGRPRLPGWSVTADDVGRALRAASRVVAA